MTEPANDDDQGERYVMLPVYRLSELSDGPLPGQDGLVPPPGDELKS